MHSPKSIITILTQTLHQQICQIPHLTEPARIKLNPRVPFTFRLNSLPFLPYNSQQNSVQALTQTKENKNKLIFKILNSKDLKKYTVRNYN